MEIQLLDNSHQFFDHHSLQLKCQLNQMGYACL